MGLVMVALAKRAIACKGWRWMPGMRIINAGIVVAVGVDGRPYRIGLMVGTGEKPLAAREQLHDIVCGCLRSSTTTRRSNESLPDLSDPATLGCLLALVRSAYGDPRAVICWQGGAQCGYWETFVADSEITADTEAEALVTALECAP